MSPNSVKIAIVLALGWVVLPIRAGEDQPVTQGSEPDDQVINASCLVQVTFREDLLWLDKAALHALLTSSGVLGAAVRQVPGLDPDKSDAADVQIFELGKSFTAEGTRRIVTALFSVDVFTRLTGDPSEARLKTEQLLGQLCKRLESELRERCGVEQGHLRAQLTEVQAAVKQAEQGLEEIQNVQQELFAAAGRSDLSRQAILEEMQALEYRQRELDMKLATLHARQNALAEQIARIGREAAAQVDGDPVVIELTKVVQLREQQVKRIQDGGARAPLQEEDKLAVARAELAKQRQAVSQRAGGELLADLNKELVMLVVDIAATEAEREFVRLQLTGIQDRKLLELADRYEREVKRQLISAREVLDDVLRRQVSLNERLTSYRAPTVVVLGGVDKS